MVAKLIDGRSLAATLRQDIAKGVIELRNMMGSPPGLGVILVGDNPASHVYVKNKTKACAQVGIDLQAHLMPASTNQDQVLAKIRDLNADPRIHGILIQLPLPDSIDTSLVISHIAPHKDVDGLHPHNLGLLFSGRPNLVPCTPLGCVHLIKSVVPNLDGKHVVVVGRSLLVGRTTALLLSYENATVVQAHSHTVNLKEECRRADILVSAVGKPGLITSDHVKPGGVVIDVGITRVATSDESAPIQGDVAFEEVAQVAGFITPVPGGVGPMTIAYLLSNTLMAAQKIKSIL
ncbi:MAG: bifunctional methylenetetrahydrofolate dehydrogenase/methenyltetrahydrofolate cyclohydrolase FolD [Alphaproteobacteria bacterium]|jgi:methylenetetrahydrofolate dehydrogenase (NADP+)/methenyltetrahydrofolate cyclohydrolase|nr:bifunctional methylenetetrahydrofolate dehydrogenase/methenyltetrahydrofolate cyclohydrolase FolD [Alphaproteobacteria bacterium]